MQSVHNMQRQMALNTHHERSNAGEFRDLTAVSNPDFREAIEQLQACRGNSSRLRETINTVLGTGDTNGTYDLDISIPDGFWDKIIAQTESLANVRAIPTNSHKIESNELTLGSNGEDVWRPGVEGTDPGDTGTLDTANREFIPEEVIAIWGITDHVLEDNIEHGTLESHIRTMIEASAANEWAKAAYNGTKVGTTNSHRGSITGCFDGFVQQINDGGNIVYATSYEDRYVSSIEENDKFLAGAKALPSKYGNSGGFTWLSSRSILMDWNAMLGQRQTGLGDTRIQGGYWMGLSAQGFPMYHVPALRTNYLVKATGTVAATTPLDTTLGAVAKARATTLTVASIANAGNGLIYTVGTDAAGTSYNLNAEKVTQSGTASGTTITLAAALARDHASGEYVTEYDVAPTITGTPALLTAWDNLSIYYQRVARIEAYRLPRTRQTDFIMTARWVPVVMNPDAAVIVRDLLAR